MTVVNHATGEALERRPEIPLQVITPNDVRASIKRAKVSLEKAAEEIVWQIEREAWRTLGYSSWNAMREAEYGEAAFMVPRKDRPELVGRMRKAGLTQQEIADTAGVSQAQVNADIRGLNISSDNQADAEPQTVTNARGQERPATYARHDSERVNTATGELTPDATTDPAPAESVAITVTCPTCHGTGEVTR